MIEIYDCGIDGVMTDIYLKLIDNCLIVEKTIYKDDDWDYLFAVAARQQYNKTLQFTQLGKMLKYDEANANCYIKRTENYPRSNPQEISLIYQLHPLRQINAGQQLFVKPYTFIEANNTYNKKASSPLRQQPDYGFFTTQDKMNQIAKQLYQQSNIVSEIVEDLYNKQVKHASKYI